MGRQGTARDGKEREGKGKGQQSKGRNGKGRVELDTYLGLPCPEGLGCPFVPILVRFGRASCHYYTFN